MTDVIIIMTKWWSAYVKASLNWKFSQLGTKTHTLCIKAASADKAYSKRYMVIIIYLNPVATFWRGWPEGEILVVGFFGTAVAFSLSWAISSLNRLMVVTYCLSFALKLFSMRDPGRNESDNICLKMKTSNRKRLSMLNQMTKIKNMDTLVCVWVCAYAKVGKRHLYNIPKLSNSLLLSWKTADSLSSIPLLLLLLGLGVGVFWTWAKDDLSTLDALLRWIESSLPLSDFNTPTKRFTFYFILYYVRRDIKKTLWYK